jgi:hypothetical protein
MSLLRQMRGGRDYDARFHARFKGEGVFAQLLERRYRVAAGRLGYAGRNEDVRLDTTKFHPPALESPQGELFR